MSASDIIVVFLLVFLVALALLGLAPSRPDQAPDKVVAGLVIVAALALALTIYGDIALDAIRRPAGYVRPWNIFHYYLGAKYFPELGYFNLYSCALAADDELQGVWDDQTPVRNLTSYVIGTRQASPPCPGGQFSTDRWARFRADLLLVQQLAPPDSAETARLWRQVLTDKGFNPSPVWATFSWWLTNHIPLTSGPEFKLLVSLDIILLAMALGLVGWTFGWETAAVALACLVTFWGPYRRLAGNVLQYGWLVAVLLGFSFWQRGWFKTSAVFFAYSITTYLFPVFFMAGLLIRLIAAGVRRQPATVRPLITFFAWLLLFCWLFLMGSLLLPTGPAAWVEFSAKLQRHSAALQQELLNVGLKNLLSTCCDAVNTPAAFEYAAHLAERSGLYLLLGGGLLALFVAYSLRSKNSDLSLMALGYAPLFALVTVSRYYYLGLVVLLLPRQNRRAATVGLLGTNLAVYVMSRFLFTQDDTLFYSYWLVQAAYLLFFAGLLVPWPRLKPADGEKREDTPHAPGLRRYL